MLFSLRKLLHTFRFFNGYIDWSWKYPRLLRKFQSYSLQLRALRGSAAGRRVFIVGSGPSLKQTDLSALAGHVVIAVNSSYKLLLERGIHPDYLLIEDRFSAQSISESGDLSKLTKTKLLIALSNSDLKFPRGTIFYQTNYPTDQEYFEQNLQFSQSFNSIVFLGGAIIFQALQFAYFLKVKEVFLLGVDFNYGKAFLERFDKKQGTTIVLTQEDIPVVQAAYFSNNYQQFRAGDSLNIPNWDYQLRAFQLARQTLESHEIAIFNASPNSMLEVFEKVDLNSKFSI